ncbi:MAG TPA: 3'(2'),5'-bisphosphate nucleotidase CysQ [Candidatus Alistipes avicola]|uniref:3'(2'),5'-bisphosphate nucleotidase CysQ n=1 Tax=Candidatus Alistipes avicola TaxID=2838432 RepID=A0A9D2RIA9_9BACT|nr:3'(2'),5'-bisphosphate nucleotidase CysQ [uncultured Alistipes sp.]HJA99317.1 3'(2'),5'-bisphosphate nucleotidase CysQ [Candidatus Alistipes avicola]
MLDNELKALLVPSLCNAVVRAGAAIMQVYRHKDDYDIRIKSDKTPITEADRQAHDTIKNYLGQTRIPILSEEGREMRYEERCNWELFWLVDPLDGTVEFIKGNNEFTVNIALMQNNRSVAAAVYVPYLEKLYLAWLGGGAYLKQNVAPRADAEYTYDQIREGLQRLPLETTRHDRPRVAVSRSHQSPETAEFVAGLRAKCPDLEIVEQGSSYKFCMLAEGDVDFYVRTTPTYEWDTAAGELILSEAGGETLSLPDNRPLQYNKADLQNPWFVCRGKNSPF